MSSFEHPIPAPRLITASSLPISAGNAANPKAEPAVELKVDTLPLIPIPGLPLVRAPIATSKTVPTSNDGFGNLPLDDVPGMGIVLPNGLNMYYLDIGPNSEGNLHRTTSTDYIVVLQGTLSLITPDGEFNLETGCKALKETLCHPGEVVYQRGIMHALSNRTDQWVRAIAVVASSNPNRVPVEGSSSEYRTLDDAWVA